MSELVKDSTYQRFLNAKPEMPPHMKNRAMASSPPWVVYIQKKADGPWGRKSFWKYKKALKFMYWAVLEVKVHDAALNNKRFGYDPPDKLVRVKGKYVVGSDGVRRQKTKYIPWMPPLSPEDPQHLWCRYCRRPTVFKFYRRHRVLGQVDETVARCCICGASTRIALSGRDRVRVH